MMKSLAFTAVIKNKDYQVDRTFDGSPAIYRWNTKLEFYEHIDEPGKKSLTIENMLGSNEAHVIIIARECET